MLLNKRLLFICFVLVFSAFLTQANANSQFPIPTQVAPGKWGYKDSATGHFRIFWHFNYAWRFEENGLAKVMLDGKFGYIDTFGELRIPFLNAEFGPFENKRAYNIVNHKGYLSVEDGMYAIHKPNEPETAELHWKRLTNDIHYLRFRYPADSLRVLAFLNAEPEKNPEAIDFQQLEPFKVSTVTPKWGYRYKHTGQIAIFWEFDGAANFGKRGLAKVKIGNQFGYINSVGALVIPLSLSEFGDFNTDTAFKVTDSFSWIELKGQFFRKHLPDGQFTEWSLLHHEKRFRTFRFPDDSTLVLDLLARQRTLDLNKLLPIQTTPIKQKPRLVISGGASPRFYNDTFNSAYNNLTFECQVPITRNLFIVGGISQFVQNVYTPKTQYQRLPLTPDIGIMVHTSQGYTTGGYIKACMLPLMNNSWQKYQRSNNKKIPMQEPDFSLLSGVSVEFGLSLRNRIDIGVGYTYMPINIQLPSNFENTFRASLSLNLY